ATTLATMPKASKPHFIVTTNYDTTVERAFKLAGAPLCVITQNMRDPEDGRSRVTLRLPGGQVGHEDAVSFQWSDDTQFPPGCTFLFKMHGSVHPADSELSDDLIITEDDYIDLMLNSGGAMSAMFPPVSLVAAFRKRRFLFLGYSMHDWNFRFLRLLMLRNVLSGRDQLRHWAIQKSPDPLEVALWQQRNVMPFEASLEDFCDGLKTAWDSEPPEVAPLG
ncbi:MAG TPA: SIR2 family protein, partial [Streptosporangiaceae bacterium]|nr:SIR2 family protein [Streptosporangiaceae bacterium]